MRRLPVFFVLDVSESMMGDNLAKMEDGLVSIVRSLRQDPHALESVYLSIIAFAGKAETIVPLVDVAAFYPPKLPIGSGTALGAALTHLMGEIDRSVIQTTAEKKGDWQPIVYLFTDGKPTDSVDIPITRWKRSYEPKAHIVAIALGQYADLAVLKQLTETVLVFENAKESDFTNFIKWVTASVTAQSRSVGEGQSQGIQLAKLDESWLRIIKDVPPAVPNLVDKDCVVFTGRCQKTRKPYLMKYDRTSQNIVTNHFDMAVNYYRLTGCSPIDESYFVWSDPGASDLKINTEELIGTPGCPHCGNPSAFAMCECGGLLCVGGPGSTVCPWCTREISFDMGHDSGGFDVRRGRG
jgi:uncharacterized protein YegL